MFKFCRDLCVKTPRLREVCVTGARTGFDRSEAVRYGTIHRQDVLIYLRLVLCLGLKYRCGNLSMQCGITPQQSLLSLSSQSNALLTSGKLCINHPYWSWVPLESRPDSWHSWHIKCRLFYSGSLIRFSIKQQQQQHDHTRQHMREHCTLWACWGDCQHFI